MTRYYDHSWFRFMLLLGALAAGLLLTKAVPTYEEMAATRERPTVPASSATQPRANKSSNVTGIDVDQRHLQFVRSIA